MYMTWAELRVIWIWTHACAITNEACGLIGAQPLGSEEPSLNLGAASNSVTLGRCLNLSEL